MFNWYFIFLYPKMVGQKFFTDVWIRLLFSCLGFDFSFWNMLRLHTIEPPLPNIICKMFCFKSSKINLSPINKEINERKKPINNKLISWLKAKRCSRQTISLILNIWYAVQSVNSNPYSYFHRWPKRYYFFAKKRSRKPHFIRKKLEVFPISDNCVPISCVEKNWTL